MQFAVSLGPSLGQLSFPWWLRDHGGFFQPHRLHTGVTARGWGGKTGEPHLAFTYPYSGCDTQCVIGQNELRDQAQL